MKIITQKAIKKEIFFKTNLKFYFLTVAGLSLVFFDFLSLNLVTLTELDQ